MCYNVYLKKKRKKKRKYTCQVSKDKGYGIINAQSKARVHTFQKIKYICQ